MAGSAAAGDVPLKQAKKRPISMTRTVHVKKRAWDQRKKQTEVRMFSRGGNCLHLLQQQLGAGDTPILRDPAKKWSRAV